MGNLGTAGTDRSDPVSGTRGHADGFGQMLRDARAASCLTQAELAELSGLSVRAISDMERGRTRRPHRQSLRLLAAAMGLPDNAAEQLIRAARTNARIASLATGAVPR